MGIFAAVRKFFSPPPKPLDGPVTFDESKFCVAPPRPRELGWDAVERIVTYKIDLLTFDEIRVQFDFAGGSVTVTEESPGFPEFMQEVVRRFPSAANWHARVSQPAFATNRTLLFDRLHT
jgi:hypothetical protein